MTPEDYRKYLQDTNPAGASSFPPQIRAPDQTDGGENGPKTDPARMVDPAVKTDQMSQAGPMDQATLQDKYGTGFINFGQYGKDSPFAQQFQPIPDSSGSLYDPTPAPTPQGFVGNPNDAGQVGQGTQAPPPPPPEMPDWNPTEQGGPLKPPFRRTRTALGYRGGEY